MSDYDYHLEQISTDVSDIKQNVGWISGIISGLVIGAILLGWFGGNDNQITDYYMVCNDSAVLQNSNLSEAQAVSQCTQWNNLTAEKYTVNFDSQFVIDDTDMTSMTGSCVVVDAKNWSCGGVGFQDGKYFIDGGDLLPTKHLGWFTYMDYKIGSWLSLHT